MYNFRGVTLPGLKSFIRLNNNPLIKISLYQRIVPFSGLSITPTVATEVEINRGSGKTTNQSDNCTLSSHYIDVYSVYCH